MCNHHALGNARGPRREENVRRVVWAVLPLWQRGRAAAQVGPRKPRREPRALGGRGRHPAHVMLGCEPRIREQFVQQAHHWPASCPSPRREDPAVVARRNHLHDARRGTRGIEGDIDRVRLEHAQHSHHYGRRLGHEQTDPIAPLHAGLSQESGEPVALFLKLTVRQSLVARHDRGCLRPAQGLRSDPVLQQLAHDATRLVACSNTTRMCPSSSGLAGTSRMNVR